MPRLYRCGAAAHMPGSGGVAQRHGPYHEPVMQRPAAGTIPDAPAPTSSRTPDGRVIYVGKAKRLRSRLSNYFQSPSSLPPRTAEMMANAETVEWIQVRNDVEALMLEYSLIKAAPAPLQRPAPR